MRVGEWGCWLGCQCGDRCRVGKVRQVGVEDHWGFFKAIVVKGTLSDSAIGGDGCVGGWCEVKVWGVVTVGGMDMSRRGSELG